MEDEESIKTDQNDHRSTSQSSHSSCKSTPFGRPIGKLSELMAEEKGSSMLRPVGSNKCIKLYVGTYILVSLMRIGSFSAISSTGLLSSLMIKVKAKQTSKSEFTIKHVMNFARLIINLFK